MYKLNKINQSILLVIWGIGYATLSSAQETVTEQTNPVQQPIAISPSAESNETETVPLLSSVIVTGSRTRENRTVASSPTPIDVISNDNIKQANQRNLLEALNNTLPSFNVPTLPGYGINSTVKAGQLRGLNSSHTLVLVNGKRRHSTARLGAGGFTASAPVDLGLIPTGSIERIEVLRDGAAAIYGSDAIAGVINIITKKDDHGGEVSAKYGGYTEGDGTLQQYIAGAGFKLGDEGHVYISAQYDKQGAAFRDSPVPGHIQYYFPIDVNGNEVAPGGSPSFGPTLPPGATPNPKEAGVDRNNTVFGASGGVPESELASLTVDLSYPLSDKTELYAFASYADRETRSPQHFRFPSRDIVVRALWPDGFTPYTGVDEEDYSLQLGVKGTDLAGWDWDFSTVYGADNIDAYQYSSNSPSFGLDSKKDFYTGSYKYNSWVNNFDLKRSFEQGLLGWLTDVSLGAEYRREGYKRTAGELQSWAYGPDVDPEKFANGEYGYVLDGPNKGTLISISDAGSQADTGIRPEDTADDSRNSYALYAGLSVYPTEKLIIDTGLRFEDYSDFGDIVTGRVSSRYDFTPKIALRGTVSTGFQAPALAAQGYKATGVTVSETNRTLAVNSAAAQALGAESLKPEESKNYSLGFVFRPLRNLNIALDAYQIDVKDRISALSTIRASNLETDAQKAAFSSFVQSVDPSFGPNDGIDYFINAGKTKTRGLDLTIEYLLSTDRYGSFLFTAAGNWNKTELVSRAATPAALTAFGFSSDLTYNASSIANLEYLSPRFKGIVGLNWHLEKWSAGLTATRFGEIRRSTSVNVDGVSTPKVFNAGNLWLVDAQVGYKFTDQLSLTLNGNNIFDQKPRKLPANTVSGPGLLWPFQSYSYLNNSPINAAGSFYSAALNYKW
ncbi:TonB-dependent receptor plug domain-containing protein [Acinetobacter puyangensis]|uniref:TonB-dependent receptor plug domain-containing protein n=1 Tax=Acinetobacter puyangensis TaxID=1096779 RepID=UPI003A4D51A6